MATEAVEVTTAIEAAIEGRGSLEGPTTTRGTAGEIEHEQKIAANRPRNEPSPAPPAKAKSEPAVPSVGL